MLDMPICLRVGDHGLVHMDVIVITEIQELFSCELSSIVGDDKVRDPKIENDFLDEIHGLHGANFGQGLHLDPKFQIPQLWTNRLRSNSTLIEISLVLSYHPHTKEPQASTDKKCYNYEERVHLATYAH
jgi:hypothetical protein